MIQANELRVGNLLHSRDKDGDGSIVVVESIFKEGINSFVSQGGYDYEYRFESTDRYDWSWVEPIPITPSILKNSGFKVEYTNGGWLRWQKGEFKLLDRRLSHPQYHAVKAMIIYVHQLQNLYFSLTAEELEINL